MIEISPNANPPIVKIANYGKYKYEQKKKQKAGRKKTIIKDIREYLKFNFEESKETFINELKKLAYINDKKEFAHLIMAIDNISRLKKADQKEWKEAFEKGLNAITQSQTNFNDRFKNKDSLLISRIEKKLKQIIDQNNLI